MLFCAGSGFGLLNALLVKLHYFREEVADIMIPGGGIWDGWAERLCCTKIFNRVWTNDGAAERERVARRLWDEGRGKEAVRIVLGDGKVLSDYDSFFLVGDSRFAKAVYYTLAHRGVAPKLSLVEGGIASYIENISQPHHWPDMDSTAEGRLEAMYLFRPPLDRGGSEKPVFRIPMLTECVEGMVAARTIFGEETLPEARYIFLADDTSRLSGASDHLMILDRLGAMVGKENILVRPHPASEEWAPLFRLHGYRVSDSIVPWEVLALMDEQPRRVITAVASHGVITSWLASGKCWPMILFKDLTVISRHWYFDAPVYNDYLQTAKKAVEMDAGGLFLPRNNMELSLIVKYLHREGY